MSKPFIDVQDDILALLKGTAIPSVFEGAVPAGYKLPNERGMYLPYAVVSFGGQSPVAGPLQGITTSADDLKWSSVAVEVVASSPRDVRRAADIVRSTLEGHEPDSSWGELSERLSGDYQVLKPDMDFWPIRHATTIVFGAHVNAVTGPQQLFPSESLFPGPSVFPS